MTRLDTADSELGEVLFQCQPRSLHGFFWLVNQGALPPFRWSKFLHPVIVMISPVCESLIFGCMPMMLSIMVLQLILGLKPPHEPSWVRPFIFTVLAIFLPAAIWSFWMAPRKDYVIVHEHGFSWQASLSRWNWFRSRGSIAMSDLESFSYRSDCFATGPVDWGKTTGEKLSRIMLEVTLSHYDIIFHLKNKGDVTVERFFARFQEADLKRFLDHLATHAEPRRVTV